MVGLGGDRRVPPRELAGRLQVATELLPLAIGRDDGRQLGVPLVEPLGQPLVRVGLGRGQLLLELRVLLDEPGQEVGRGEGSGAGAGNYLDSASAGAFLA
jgi:hypothetical protein